MSRHLRASGNYTYCGLLAAAVKTAPFRLLITCPRCYELHVFYHLLGIEPTEWQTRAMAEMSRHR